MIKRLELLARSDGWFHEESGDFSGIPGRHDANQFFCLEGMPAYVDVPVTVGAVVTLCVTDVPARSVDAFEIARKGFWKITDLDGPRDCADPSPWICEVDRFFTRLAGKKTKLWIWVEVDA